MVSCRRASYQGRPSRPLSVEAVRPPRIWLLAGAAGLAIVAELVSYDVGDDLALTLADGIVGLVMLGSGVIAWDRRLERGVAVLMGVSGLAWFAGSFFPGLVFLHRGPLVHLHISYPT